MHERVSKVKFCDYQLMAYDTLALDLIFFLFSSVQHMDRKQYFEHFLQHYHKQLFDTLATLGCPLDDYTYAKCVVSIIFSELFTLLKKTNFNFLFLNHFNHKGFELKLSQKQNMNWNTY